MKKTQSTRYFSFSKPIYFALKNLSHKFEQNSLQIEYLEDNMFRVHDWADDRQECLKL